MPTPACGAARRARTGLPHQRTCPFLWPGYRRPHLHTDSAGSLGSRSHAPLAGTWRCGCLGARRGRAGVDTRLPRPRTCGLAAPVCMERRGGSRARGRGRGGGGAEGGCRRGKGGGVGVKRGLQLLGAAVQLPEAVLATRVSAGQQPPSVGGCQVSCNHATVPQFKTCGVQHTGGELRCGPWDARAL
eukprot:364535-Chlamydomonas_euryale.AAC.1